MARPQPFSSPASAPGFRPVHLLCGLIALLAFPGGAAWADSEDLRINEFMASNRTTLLDEAGDADDWLEILNSGMIPVNLEGMFLTDEVADPQMWEFPDTVLSPGAFLIVWCDDEGDEGPLHASFHLNADGEFAGLYESLGMGNGVIDSTSFGHQAPDISYGRYPDGLGPFGYMPTPTPGGENAPFGNIPPFFEDTAHSPLDPEAWEEVSVVTTISDDSEIVDAQILFDRGDGFVSTGLFDDGAHGDSLAGDGIYGGTIPGQANGTHVAYYVWALDDSAATSTDPENAPEETYGYDVGYLPPALFLNELMALNETTIADEFGEYDDWVEIFNGTSLELDLGGFHLTDDPQEPDQFALPDTVLPAGGFLLVWCDNDEEQGPLHTNFRLSGDGEFVGLYDRIDHGLVPVDTLSFGPQTEDISYGRETDGGEPWVFFTVPTPGASNQGTAVDDGPLGDLGFGLIRVPVPARHHLQVTFRMPRSGPASLDLFDPVGRRVALWQGHAIEGSQAVRLSAAQLPSGVYVLQLKGDGQRSSARVILLR